MAGRRTVAVIVIGLSSFGALLIGGCVLLLYKGFVTTDAAVSQRVDVLFAAIEGNTFPATYDTETTPEFRSAMSREQYVEMGKVIAARLGHLKAKKRQGFNVRQFNAATYVDASYSATFEKGTATITVGLKRQGGQWKILKFYVQSPVLLQHLDTATCAKCGASHSEDARFCPSCGAKVVKDENSDDKPKDKAPGRRQHGSDDSAK